MQIIKLRLGRKETAVPFSLGYLFKGDRVADMRQHFETFLGFPVRHFEHPIEAVGAAHDRTRLDEIVPDLRDVEANWHLAIPILTSNVARRLGNAKRADPRVVPEEPPEGEKDAWGEAGPYVMYLTEDRWKNWVAKDDAPPEPRGAYPETGYLSTPMGVIRPPCFACPRLLLHQGGECALGDQVCFSHLSDFKAQGQMARKLVQFEKLMNETESVRTSH